MSVGRGWKGMQWQCIFFHHKVPPASNDFVPKSVHHYSPFIPNTAHCARNSLANSPTLFLCSVSFPNINNPWRLLSVWRIILYSKPVILQYFSELFFINFFRISFTFWFIMKFLYLLATVVIAAATAEQVMRMGVLCLGVWELRIAPFIGVPFDSWAYSVWSCRFQKRRTNSVWLKCWRRFVVSYDLRYI